MAGETLSAKLGLDTASFNKPLKEASDLWVAEQKKIAQAAQASAAQVDAAQKKQAATISQSIGSVKEGLGTLTGAGGEAGGALSKVWGLISKVPGVGPIAAIAGSLTTVVSEAIKTANSIRALDREMQAVFTRPVSSGSSIEVLQGRLESLRNLSAKIAERKQAAGEATTDEIPTIGGAFGAGLKSAKTKLNDVFANTLIRPFTGEHYNTTQSLEEAFQRVQAERSRTNRLIGQKRVAEAQGSLDTSFGFNPEAESEAIKRNYKSDLSLATTSEGGATEMKQAADLEHERAQKALDRRVQEVSAATRNAARGAENQKTAMSDSAEQAEYAEAARKAAEAKRQLENEIAPGGMRDDRQRALDQSYQNEIDAIGKKYRIEREELALQRETTVLKGTSAQNSIASLQKEIAMLEKRLKTEKNLNDEEKNRINTQLTAAKAGLRTAGISQAGEEEATSGAWRDSQTTEAYNSQLDAMKGKLKDAIEYQKKLYTTELDADEATKAAAADKVNGLKKQIAEMQRLHGLELASAQTETVIMEAQRKGHKSLALQLAIELEYRQKIADAIKAGNPELVNQLTQQKKYRETDAAVEDHRKTPEQRRQERKEAREYERDAKLAEREEQSALEAHDRGETIDPNSRRGAALDRALEKRKNGELPDHTDPWKSKYTFDAETKTREGKWPVGFRNQATPSWFQAAKGPGVTKQNTSASQNITSALDASTVLNSIDGKLDNLGVNK